MTRYVLPWPPEKKPSPRMSQLDILRLLSDEAIFEEVNSLIHGSSIYPRMLLYKVARERGISNIEEGKAPPPPPPPLLY